MVSASHDRLPFGCLLRRTDDLQEIVAETVNDWLNPEYFKKPDTEPDEKEVPFVLDVFVASLSNGFPAMLVQAENLRTSTKQEESQMAYVLEKITPEDQQKIIDDADPRVKKYLRRALEDWKDENDSFGVFPRSWAIDRERGHYLFRMPRYFREDTYNPYGIFVYGRMYLFRQVHVWNYFFFDEKEPSPPEELSRVQSEIVAALLCHGLDVTIVMLDGLVRVNFVPKPAGFTPVY
jgi:hypothetical protein